MFRCVRRIRVRTVLVSLADPAVSSLDIACIAVTNLPYMVCLDEAVFLFFFPVGLVSPSSSSPT